jgi:hypothetical protein
MNIDVVSLILGFIGGAALVAIIYFAYTFGQKSTKKAS